MRKITAIERFGTKQNEVLVVIDLNMLDWVDFPLNLVDEHILSNNALFLHDESTG